MKMPAFSLSYALITLLLISGCARADDATADLVIKATVVADCTVSVSPTSVDLGKVSVTTLKNTSHNTELPEMSQTVTVTSTCQGTSAAKLSASTQNTVKDGYISPDGDALRFGVETTFDSVIHKFDDTGNTTVVTWTNQSDLNTGHQDTIKLFALAGTNMSPSAGTYTATMTFKLEPE